MLIKLCGPLPPICPCGPAFLTAVLLALLQAGGMWVSIAYEICHSLGWICFEDGIMYLPVVTLFP